MNQAARHARVSAVFLTVCDLAAAEREDAIIRECRGDADLEREVRAMLASDADETFLNGPAIAPDDEVLPERIGPFKVVALLGRGGSAAVYEARQESPERRVAVKVLRRTWITPESTRRLRQEGELLARLHHPGVATVYQVGAFEGSPYIAMELVEGETLAAYAERARPSTRRRLELMAEVCDAVHHAHQRAVIHRDLKPSNILIDAEGRPKIIDFGVARIVNAECSATLATSPGQVVGTLAYVSPEQLLADGSDIDTRADVFALGVILFELLTGRRPREVGGQPIAQAIDLLRHQAPMRLRRADPTLPRDLDAIAAKALAMEPLDRYASAAALAEDMRRFLRDETISARAPSALYEAGKFVRRRRGVVAAALVGTLLLAAGVTASTAQWARAVRAEQARDAALLQSQERIARAFSSILTPVAAWARSESGRGGKGLELARVTSAAALSEKFPDDPGAESDYHRTLGNLFRTEFGYPELAVQHFRRALDASHRAGVARHEATVKLMQLLGDSLVDAREAAEAEELLIRAAALAPGARLDAPGSMAIIERQIARAQLALGKFDEAAASLRRALGHVYAVHPRPNAESIELLGELGNALRRADQIEEAITVLRDALADCEALGDENARARIARLLGRVERDAANFDEAERLQLAALAQARLRPGQSNQHLASALGDLAQTYAAKGDLAASESRYREALAAMRSASKRWPPNEEKYLEELLRLLERSPDRVRDAAAVRAELEEVRAELGRRAP